MSNAVFPVLPGLAWDVVKRPTFSTIVQRAASGREVRAALWSSPIWQWELTYDLLRDDATNELRTLMGFFLQRQGSFDSFLYSDPTDNAVTGQLIGTGNATTKIFQMTRTLGGFVEPVFDVSGTPTIKLNGVTQATPGQYTISSSGVVTLVTAPASGVTITGDFSYYFRCRFMEDMAEFQNFASKLWELRTLELMGVKP
jgi:uncharacterized protein (TIGR02217 family)